MKSITPANSEFHALSKEEILSFSLNNFHTRGRSKINSINHDPWWLLVETIFGRRPLCRSASVQRDNGCILHFSGSYVHDNYMDMRGVEAWIAQERSSKICMYISYIEKDPSLVPDGE